MIDSKLTFRIQEIPDGISTKEVALGSGDLAFSEPEIVKADLSITFEKGDTFLNVRFEIDAVVELICDRSLKTFEHPVSCNYEVLFQPEVEEESETERSKVKQFNIHELTLSIDREVRDTLLLEIPIKKIHPEFLDEEGRPEEFETKKFGGREWDEDEPVDPRWEKLKNLKKQ